MLLSVTFPKFSIISVEHGYNVLQRDRTQPYVIAECTLYPGFIF